MSDEMKSLPYHLYLTDEKQKGEPKSSNCLIQSTWGLLASWLGILNMEYVNLFLY